VYRRAAAVDGILDSQQRPQPAVGRTHGYEQAVVVPRRWAVAVALRTGRLRRRAEQLLGGHQPDTAVFRYRVQHGLHRLNIELGRQPGA
jgi:hypothetical protein